MEKKQNDQKDPLDKNKKDHDLETIRNKDTPDRQYDSNSLLDDEADQTEEEDDLNFHKFENEDFVEELNQQNKEKEEGDPLDFQDNPYLDDEILEGPELDIPGSELDDEMEDIGSEDEENNYYSLGGDNHENLEERDEEF